MKKPPIRLWIAVMIFFSTFTNYMMRANMSVSVGEMAKPTGAKNKTNPCNRVTNTPTNSSKGEFAWSQADQGQLIAAYFYGTMVSFFHGGTIAERLGAVNVIASTSLAIAILTAACPFVAKFWGLWPLFTVRFITGVLGGPVYPALNVLVARWSPPNEKGKFTGAFMGNTIGVVVTWLMVGYSTAQWGWEAGFYSISVLMAAYSIIFYFVTTDTPQKHKCISPEEVEYIEKAQGGTVSNAKKFPPYGKIFSSIRFWATIVAQFGNLWALNLMLTYAPKYFKETLGFDLKSSVGYASIPYLTRLVTSQIFGLAGDYMRKHEVMSVTNIRRFFLIFSHVIPAICFFCMYLTGCNFELVLALLAFNQGLNGALVVGHMQNCQDLAPNFAGTLYGIMNWIGSCTGFIVPSINAFILKQFANDQLLGAAIIFMIGGVVLLLTATFFAIFVSGDVQSWNDIEPPKETAAQ